MLCMQELHISGVDFYITEEGASVILSGGPSGMREYAGVGFLVAPIFRSYVISFKEYTDRIASLKLRVLGGQLRLILAYAPHGGHEYCLRRSFYEELSNFLHKSKGYGPTILLGDMNARFHRQADGEEDVIGPYVFGNQNAEFDPLTSRSLLFELCCEHCVQVANISSRRRMRS